MSIVPDIIGLTQAAATTALEDEGLIVSVETECSTTVAAGIVVSQFPAADEEVPDNCPVLITVSLGRKPITETDGVMTALSGLKTAISESDAFQTWSDTDDATEALTRIHNWDAEQDGDPIVVMAPAGGFTAEVVTIGQDFMFTPVISCEFSATVAKGDTNESVFDTLATAVDAIMAEVAAGLQWRIRGWEPDSTSTPARTKAGAQVNFVFYRVTVYGVS